MSWGPRKIAKLLLVSLCLSGLCVGGLAVIVLGFVIHDYSQELPVLASAQYRPPLTTKLYDVRGRLIAELQNEENRAELVSIPQIPRHTQLAFVSIEDERFYAHYGIDPEAMLRAVLSNLRAWSKRQGGSTITQQLARNRFLSLKKTWTRKLQEMIMSVRLERHYTKDEILCQYLNEIFFGGNVYGISSAAKTYFGKRVEDLTLAESAVLAGMLPAPNRYSPLSGTLVYKERQRLVLQKMWEQGYITKEQAVRAYLEPIASVTKEERVVQAPYFVEHVRKELVDRFGSQRALAEGLKVYTTLDLDQQKLGEECFRKAEIFARYPSDQYPDLQGAFMVMDPTDGAVKAMIGGRDFLTYKFNRATMARRQPGSCFKPLVYCTALQQGIPPNTIIADEPIRYLIPNSDEYWEPRNYDERFHGPTILARALEQSYNIVAIKMLERIGVENVVAMAKKLGVKSPIEPDLSLALGTSEMTLLEMISAYACFADEGIRVEPRAVLRVEDQNGEVVWDNELKEAEVLDERLAYLMTHLLLGVVERGTGVKARVPGHEIAGKTGTTNDFADAWFIVYTPNLVVGASFGFDSRKTLGTGMSGPRVAAPVVAEFMHRFLAGQEPREFHVPDGVEIVKVCRDTGLLPMPSCRVSVPLAFVRGKTPSTYCHLHQPIDYTLSEIHE